MPGIYAPPAVELPNTTHIVGSRISLRRVRSRKPRPPGTKIFDWFGRSAPALSIREIDGRPFSSARFDKRPDLITEYSLIAPPFTVASEAVIMHSTPLTIPTPPTTLAPGA